MKLIRIIAALLAMSSPVFAQGFPGLVPTDSVLCRDTAGTGQVEVCSVAGALSFTGTKGLTVTGANILTQLLTVDGSGSGLDADLLDGHDTSFFQTSDTELTCLAGLVSAADKFPYFTGSGTCALADISSTERTFLTTPSSANFGSVVSDDAFLLSDIELGALSGLTSAANKLPYFTGSGTAALADLSANMRTFLTTSSCANEAAVLTDELFTCTDAELGALAGLTSAADKLPYFTGSGTAALADLSSAMRTFLTTSSVANLASVLTDEASGWANWQTTPSSANLATYMTDEAFSMADIELGAIAGLTSAANKLPYFTGSGTAALADLSANMRTFMTTSSSANWAAVVTDDVFQLDDAELGAIAGLTSAANKCIEFTGAGTAAAVNCTATGLSFMALAAGTSGGIPYFSAANTVSTSGALTANGPLLGGGAGGSPTSMAAGTDGQIIVGQTSAAPLWKTVTGDVTVAASGAISIGADKVTEAMLKAVDTPGDEECLTYESTVGDFEWQTCGGGAAGATAQEAAMIGVFTQANLGGL